MQPFWTTTTRDPQLDLGLIIVSAWTLPLLAAGIFLWLKTHDAHRELCLAKAKTLLPYLLFTLRLLTLYRAMFNIKELIGNRELRNQVISCECLALILDHSFIQQADSHACVLTACAWLLVVNVFPDAQSYSNMQLGITQILLLLLFARVPFEARNAGLIISAISLVTSTMEYTAGDGALLSRVPKIFLALIGSMISSPILSPVLQCMTQQMGRRRDRLWRAYDTVCRVLAMLQMGAAGVCACAYLWPCLGWRVLRHNAAVSRSPAVTIFSLGAGGGPYCLILLLRMHSKVARDPSYREREHSFQTWTKGWLDLSINTVEWMIVGHGFAYLLLYVSP